MKAALIECHKHILFVFVSDLEDDTFGKLNATFFRVSITCYVQVLENL